MGPRPDPVYNDAYRQSLGGARTGTAIRLALVVDDEDSVRRLVVRTFEDVGFRVLAADGRQALQMLASSARRPDVVITDIIMPHVNGPAQQSVAACAPEVPVLFTSGRAGYDVAARELLPDGAPFLQKPFTPDGLIAAVDSLLPRE